MDNLLSIYNGAAAFVERTGRWFFFFFWKDRKMWGYRVDFEKRISGLLVCQDIKLKKYLSGKAHILFQSEMKT